MKHRQQGFTLIELVLVIVILGILAATALPRFSDLSTQARVSSLSGMAGGLHSVAAIAKATQLAQNLASNASVVIEGQTITMSGGYPTAASVGNALSDTTGYANPSPGLYRILANCEVQYANAGAGAYTVTIDQTGC